MDLPRTNPKPQHTPTRTPPLPQNPPLPRTNHPSAPPPTYTPAAATRDFLALREGDPDERISVPFVYSHDKKSLADYLAFRNVGTVTRRIVARPMTRRLYNERYAHDADGKYVGTGKKAPDAGLVFIPGKSTEQELLDQVGRVAGERKNHDPKDFQFQDGAGMAPMGGGWSAG